MKIITKWSRYGLKIRFINAMKILGAFVRPNGITKNSYNPYLVAKAVLAMSDPLTLS